MKTSRSFFARPLVGVALAIATCAHASVTNVAWYRLGENDPGGISGLAVTNTTADIIGANHLKQYGSPLYTNAVSAIASTGVGSSLAVHLNGSSQYLSNAVVSTAINNFGIEMWVKPNTTNAGAYYIAYNGFMASGGWGLWQNGNAYSVLLGSVAFFGAPGSAAPGVWAHLALVRDNGTNRLYVNGVTAVTSNATPLAVTGGFAVGATPQSPTSQNFNGTIDEVRVFTFAPGQFSTNDLLLNLQRVATLPATGVIVSNATLNGSANPMGFTTSGWFEWGTTTNYGNVTPAQSLGSGNSNTNFSQLITGLVVGESYHFRAVASNGVGVAVGTNQTFTTPIFSNTGISLPGVAFGSTAWGDYDNDGQLDILLTGYDTNVALISQIWRNTGSGFTNINAGLPSVVESSVAWGDFDNDGRLDIVLTGHNIDFFGAISQVWRNTSSGFTNINAGLPGVSSGSAAWGDYDNDGRLDILLTGTTNGASSGGIAQVWRNTGSGFTGLNAGLPGVVESSVAWGDYDNDGWLDILLTGFTTNGAISQIWRNTGSGFTNINAGLPSGGESSVAWGDYDNDGRLDILLTHVGGIQVWRNTGSGFTNINAGLPGVISGSAAWGDYDNDGRLDILLTGQSPMFFSVYISQIWRNTGSGFTNINAGLPGVSSVSAAWGDYDNDGRLDILLTGSTNGAVDLGIAQVWKNNFAITNTQPAAASGLSVTATGTVATLSWTAASDSQTPAAGLSYNLRIGTTPGGSDILAPSSDVGGLRRLPQLGNAQQGLTTVFNYTAGTPYYWSVQAVDSAFAGSPFSAEESFKILSPAASVVQVQTTNQPPGDVNGDGIVDQSEFAVVLANLNGDGIVSQSELNLVLSNYFPYSPWLYLTNVAGLGGTNVTFTLSNSTAGAFSVEYTTNFANWYLLGPATPRYLFTDTNAPAVPQRSYRLRWP